MYSPVVDLGPGQCNMQWCSVYFDWVRVGLSGMHLTSAVSNVSAICQMNLFLLDTTVGFSAVILGIKQLLTQFTISLEWLRSQEFILLLKSDAVQKNNNSIVVNLQ